MFDFCILGSLKTRAIVRTGIPCRFHLPCLEDYNNFVQKQKPSFPWAKKRIFLQGWLGTRIPVGASMQEKAQPRAPAKSKPAARAPARSDGDRESGTVKWFNRSKGFGFIVRDSGGEIFVHQRSIRSSGDPDKRRPALRDGQAVTFVVIEREKGLQADDVVAA